MEKINLEAISNSVEELSSFVNESGIQPLDSTLSTVEEYSKIEDSFMRYRVMVNDALKLYDQACSIAAVSDTGYSATINRLSEPFRKGFFTLAVVGKMSAGKSTFINALLGDNNLLPTGHFQTTCTITTIQHNEQKRLRIIYGNDEEEEYTDNISEILKKLVAIPDKYKDLPVNNVNRLILYGKTIDEICSAELVEEMEALSRNTIDVANLRDYVETHPIEKIPKAVVIECPLNENYQGWRIVDTPGVDAIGGIEDDTKQFLCSSDEDGNHNVDAIIFIQAAQASIADLHLNEFVNETINSLTEEAKKRTFFVLTHGTDPAFLRNKEGIMEEAKRLFVDYGKVGIAGERLIAVDSIAALMENDQSLDLEMLTYEGLPTHWSKKEWAVCQDVLGQMDVMLRRKKIEVNNENIRRLLSELANFERLRNMLNDFVREEKRTSFDAIIRHIEEDIAHCIAIREQDIRILESNLGKKPEDFLKDLENEKAKLDEFRQLNYDKVRELRNIFSKKAVRAKFEREILEGTTIETFLKLPSINLMRRKADEAGSKAVALEKSIIDEIKEKVTSFVDTSQLNLNVALPAIDIEQIEHDAKVESTTHVRETVRARKRKGIFGGLGRLLGSVFSTNWGWETETKTVEHVDKVKLHDVSATTIYTQLTENLNTFKIRVTDELENILDKVTVQLSDVLEKRKSDYDNLAKGTKIADKIMVKKSEITVLESVVIHLGVFKN